MPYSFETNHEKLPRKKDRRVKLTEAQRQEIRDSDESIHALSRKYNVSRRLVQFIKYPERLAENLARRDERGGWEYYYNKKNSTEKNREHRRYKHNVLKKSAVVDGAKGIG